MNCRNLCELCQSGPACAGMGAQLISGKSGNLAHKKGRFADESELLKKSEIQSELLNF